MEKDKVLRVSNLNVFYKNRKRKLWSKKNRKIQALFDVSFDMEEGEVLAIAGESGCGKSTIALARVDLPHPDSGKGYSGYQQGLSGRNLAEIHKTPDGISGSL